MSEGRTKMGLVECEWATLCQVGSWFTFLLSVYFASLLGGPLSPLGHSCAKWGTEDERKASGMCGATVRPTALTLGSPPPPPRSLPT